MQRKSLSKFVTISANSIGENSKDSGYSFLVFMWGYINSSSFTEIVKIHAKKFENIYNNKDFEEPRKNLEESNSIISSAIDHAIQTQSYSALEYIINASIQLELKLIITDLIIEEILFKFETEIAGKILAICIKGKFKLTYHDEDVK